MLSVLAAVIVAPLFEELLFRAHLQSGLVSAFRKQLGPRTARWLAIVLASLAFASIHEWWTQPIIFVLSVCIGWVYERTGNLWSAIVLHATFNGSTTLLFTLTAMNQP
jgi:membrane protease YdiL (CAAX protease family)